MVNWYVTYELFSSIFDNVLIEFAFIVLLIQQVFIDCLLGVRHYSGC